jgi:hypothetical protein
MKRVGAFLIALIGFQRTLRFKLEFQNILGHEVRHVRIFGLAPKSFGGAAAAGFIPFSGIATAQ